MTERLDELQEVDRRIVCRQIIKARVSAIGATPFARRRYRLDLRAPSKRPDHRFGLPRQAALRPQFAN